MQNDSIGRLFGAEFVGTILVMLGGPGLIILTGDVSPLAVGVGYAVAMAISIGVIGAVANPMFSLALWFAKAIPGRELASDVAGQLLGGLAGGLILWGINNTNRFRVGTNGWSPGDGVDQGIDLGIATGTFAELGAVLAAELVIATLLVVILLAAIKEQPNNAATAAFVGAGYGLGAMLLIGISGAGLNPARSLGAAVFADTDPSALGQMWPFIVVPVVASFAGMLIWLAIDDETIDDTVFDDTVLEDTADAVTGD